MSTRDALGRFVGNTVPSFRCEWCGIEVWRKGNGGRLDKDAHRFCSKKCSGALRSSVAERANATAKATAAFEREVARSVKQALQDRLKDVVPKSYKGIHRRERVRHVCPDCGNVFDAPVKFVFCSRRCSQRYNKKGRPYIGSVEIHQRNQIASMLALVRAANRRIQDDAVRA